MTPRMFALVFGVVYVLVALLELLFFQDADPATQFLFYNQVHNLVHWAAGILGLLAYFGGNAVSRLYAQVFGVVFFLVAILGFIPGQPILADVLGYPVNLLYNFIHLLTGVLGIWAGFFGEMEEPS